MASTNYLAALEVYQGLQRKHFSEYGINWAGVKKELVGAAEQGELHEVDHRELIARWRE